MFNRELKRRVKDLEGDVKELRIRVDCLRGFHEWIVAQGMVIRCRHCHKNADNQQKGVGI